MHVLTGAGWRDGYLDYSCGPGRVRIRPRLWLCVAPVTGQYFERERLLRTLWNYTTELGPRAVLTKIRSRLAEAGRNEKFLSVGYGTLCTPAGEGDGPGQGFVFIAPNHPRCVERLVLDRRLVRPVAGSAPWRHEASPDAIAWYDGTGRESPESELASLAGWQPESGLDLPAPETLHRLLDRAEELLAGLDPAGGRRLPVISARRSGASRDLGIPGRCGSGASRDLQPESRLAPLLRGVVPRQPAAILFGYGNYAKTIILPNVRRHLRVHEIHETDPLQIPRHAKGRWSTSWELDPGTDAAAVLIAGWHHSHAPLAIQALRAGAAAVVEKPVVTTRKQLDGLLNALDETGGRLYACFQRRYSPANDWLRTDLGVSRDEPVSCHCIVYEEPLPPRHWYRWPASRGRLVSNGCHWIDHFLFLNDFAAVADRNVFVSSDGTVNCSLVLANGASFSMLLTDRGASRAGMQNYIEIRTTGGSAKLQNDRLYDAETRSRRVRRRMHKLEAHARMYRRIAAAVAGGEPGDSRESLAVSAGAMLDLDELAAASPAYLAHGGGVHAGTGN